METFVDFAAGASVLSSSSAVFGRRRQWILLSNKINRRKYTLKRGIDDRFPLFTDFSERTATLVSKTSSASVRKMVSNGYVGRGSSCYGYGGRNLNINKIYKRLESCLVIPPPRGKPPRAIIKFLGGAFIGAIPEEGFLIISVPYNLAFNHADAEIQVFERFHACLDAILASRLPDEDVSPAQLVSLPLFTVDHSNGALLQVLTGAISLRRYLRDNPIISFNNRPVTEAVPYFEQILLDAAGAIVPDRDQKVLNSPTKFVDQLPSVLNQMTEEYQSSGQLPTENQDCFLCSYSVQNTLGKETVSNWLERFEA